MHPDLIRCPGLYLVGFMGCGKTTIGARLADELGWPFADLDDDIEAAAGISIAGIFEARGEAEFRHLEHHALRERVRTVGAGRPLVLSLGGGAFAQQNNLDILEDHGVTVWLDCVLELIRRRVAAQTHRPLARDPAAFEQLYRERRSAYAKANYRVEIASDDPNDAIRAILALPGLFE